MPEPVPFANLVAEWQPLKAEVLQRIAAIFEHGRFILGPEVLELEQRLAADLNIAHAISCSSGTSALQLALMALGIQPGDEVILPAFTFAAPVEAVLLQGATPVLADIDPLTFNLNPASVERLLSPATRAIVAVSLYGQPADFEALQALAGSRGIALVEDAAQSYGATLGGRRSGTLGLIGCTSFFPTKPLGGAGEGGALFTANDEYAERIRSLRDHGQSGKYQHSLIGFNGRLDSLSCAAVLTAFSHRQDHLARRQQLAERYQHLLGGAAPRLVCPLVRAGRTSAWAQYAVRVQGRERIVAAMNQADVQTAIHYPSPLHTQPAYRSRVRHGPLEQAERAARELLCLPLYPSLTVCQQDRVVDVLLGAVRAEG
ncbi:MAG: DegT/DnrJ/EryC1/StrS family aminotransferase [Pseudomonas sp.]|uniref:DegT/DnrJ/EryC1/StrS family aminotransferase n=1 Tax=Pseudomonas sp. TaxID=306 RepID=UPI003392920E